MKKKNPIFGLNLEEGYCGNSSAIHTIQVCLALEFIYRIFHCHTFKFSSFPAE